MKFKQYLFYFVLPLLVFLYIIYIRIILVHLPRNITLFPNTFLLITTIIICLGLIIRIYLIIKADKTIKTGESKLSKIIEKI